MWQTERGGQRRDDIVVAQQRRREVGTEIAQQLVLLQHTSFCDGESRELTGSAVGPRDASSLLHVAPPATAGEQLGQQHAQHRLEVRAAPHNRGVRVSKEG